MQEIYLIYPYIFINVFFFLSRNPNAPRRVSYMTDGPREWLQYQVDWPEYNVKNETYFNLSELYTVSRFYLFFKTQLSYKFN